MVETIWETKSYWLSEGYNSEKIQICWNQVLSYLDGAHVHSKRQSLHHQPKQRQTDLIAQKEVYYLRMIT